MIESEMIRVAETELALANAEQDYEITVLRQELRERFTELERLLLITEVMTWWTIKTGKGGFQKSSKKRESIWNTGRWVHPVGGGARLSDKQRAMGWKDEVHNRRYFDRLAEAMSNGVIDANQAEILARTSGIKG